MQRPPWAHLPCQGHAALGTKPLVPTGTCTEPQGQAGTRGWHEGAGLQAALEQWDRQCRTQLSRSFSHEKQQKPGSGDSAMPEQAGREQDLLAPMEARLSPPAAPVRRDGSCTTTGTGEPDPHSS